MVGTSVGVSAGAIGVSVGNGMGVCVAVDGTSGGMSVGVLVGMGVFVLVGMDVFVIVSVGVMVFVGRDAAILSPPTEGLVPQSVSVLRHFVTSICKAAGSHALKKS
jgi:hypothetical protein